MSTYDLCTKLGKILSQHIKSSLYHAGLLNTVQKGNTDVHINVKAVHRELKTSLDREKARSAKTIAMLQAGIDLIEGTAKKK